MVSVDVRKNLKKAAPFSDFRSCDKVTKQRPQTTTVEEKGQSNRIRTEVPLLTSLTPYR